jgi:hypothetical protein
MGNAMSMKESKPFHYLPEETVALRGSQRGEGYIIKWQQFWHGGNTFTMTNFRGSDSVWGDDRNFMISSSSQSTILRTNFWFRPFSATAI